MGVVRKVARQAKGIYGADLTLFERVIDMIDDMIG
jgi:hypothetical protein